MNTQFPVNSDPSDVYETLHDAGVLPTTINDFLGYRKLAAKQGQPTVSTTYAAKRDALIAQHPILGEFDVFLTAIGK